MSVGEQERKVCPKRAHPRDPAPRRNPRHQGAAGAPRVSVVDVGTGGLGRGQEHRRRTQHPTHGIAWLATNDNGPDGRKREHRGGQAHRPPERIRTAGVRGDRKSEHTQGSHRRHDGEGRPASRPPQGFGANRIHGPSSHPAVPETSRLCGRALQSTIRRARSGTWPGRPAGGLALRDPRESVRLRTHGPRDALRHDGRRCPDRLSGVR